MKSGNLNFLEPSEPLQACNGTAAFSLLVKLQLTEKGLFGRVTRKGLEGGLFIPAKQGVISATLEYKSVNSSVM
jgi:hypothetical protein